MQMTNEVHLSLDEGEVPLSHLIKKDELLTFIHAVLAKRGHKNWEVSVLLTDDSKIKILNQTYRNIDSPTDVLSFEMKEEYINESGVKRYMAGDIVISLESVKDNATYFATSFNEELKRVIIHSILHLEGMDHKTNEDDEDMIILQEEILNLFLTVKLILRDDK